MWPDRRLIDLLEIEHPLVLAPMAGVGTAGLAAAVCKAGGLGSIGCGAMNQHSPPRRSGVARPDRPADQRQFLLSCAGESRRRA